jgi:hypothetical protein
MQNHCITIQKNLILQSQAAVEYINRRNGLPLLSEQPGWWAIDAREVRWSGPLRFAADAEFFSNRQWPGA